MYTVWASLCDTSRCKQYSCNGIEYLYNGSFCTLVFERSVVSFTEGLVSWATNARARVRKCEQTRHARHTQSDRQTDRQIEIHMYVFMCLRVNVYSDNCTCCHTEIEVADQIFFHTVY